MLLNRSTPRGKFTGQVGIAEAQWKNARSKAERTVLAFPAAKNNLPGCRSGLLAHGHPGALQMAHNLLFKSPFVRPLAQQNPTFPRLAARGRRKSQFLPDCLVVSVPSDALFPSLVPSSLFLPTSAKFW
jgi:hypothetical protein